MRFYGVRIEGALHPRVAWSYEAPLASMEQVCGRFGFWEEVAVASAR